MYRIAQAGLRITGAICLVIGFILIMSTITNGEWVYDLLRAVGITYPGPMVVDFLRIIRDLKVPIMLLGVGGILVGVTQLRGK